MPLDGGTSLLLLAGVGLAATKLRRRGAAALVLLGGLAGSAQAQAVLSPGDVVVTSYYTDVGNQNGDDSVGLVATVDLPQGTVFRISDGGWTGTAIRPDMTSVGGFVGGVLATYTAPCDVPAGTAFEYHFNGTAASSSTYTCPAGGNAAAGFVGTS